MTDIEIMILIAGLIAAFAWWVFVTEYRSYRVDVLRHCLFVTRDHLFLQAARGEIPFDNPAYLHTRRMLNCLIRYADELSFLNMILVKLALQRHGCMPYLMAHKEQIKREILALSDDECKIIINAMGLAHIYVMNFMLLTSPVFFPLAGLFNLLVHRISKKLSNDECMPSNSRQDTNPQLRKLIEGVKIKEALQDFVGAAECLVEGVDKLAQAA